jgi:hypothetical protein
MTTTDLALVLMDSREIDVIDPVGVKVSGIKRNQGAVPGDEERWKS